jgi:hypothetical protein
MLQLLPSKMVLYRKHSAITGRELGVCLCSPVMMKILGRPDASSNESYGMSEYRVRRVGCNSERSRRRSQLYLKNKIICSLGLPDKQRVLECI